MNCQVMERQGGALTAYYQVKEVNLNRVHTV